MFAVDHEELQGIKIKTFHFLRNIGKGQFARVYEAYDEKDGSTVAIKVIPIKLLSSKKIKQLAQSEIKIMKACQGNRNIIKFIDNFKSKSSIFIVMEFCAKGSLQEYLQKQGRLTEHKATDYLKQLMNGFKGLHQRQVIHRDLKDANVLINDKGILKIADLGFAKMLTEGVTSTQLGTPLTMAPEVHFGLPYGLKADLWSLGVVYYKMIYNKYPYQGQNEQQIFEASKKPPNFSKVNISQNAQDFISKCLTFDAQKRISWIELYNHPLITEKEVFQYRPKIDIQDRDEGMQFYKNNKEIKRVQIKISHNFDKLQEEEGIKETKVQIEKAKLRNQTKRDSQKKIAQYKDLYINKRNNILFIFKHITPYVSSLYKLPIDHNLYLFVLCKNAYIQFKQFNKLLLEKKNFMQLNHFFADFLKSQEYMDILQSANDELMATSIYAEEFKKEIKENDYEVKQEYDLDKVWHQNWKEFFSQVLMEYQNKLMKEMKSYKEENNKNKLIKLIEAVNHLKVKTNQSDFEVFEKYMENISFIDAEMSIQARQQYLLHSKK